MNKINIRGVLFDNLDMDGAVSAVMSHPDGGGAFVIHTPNSEIVQSCIENGEYMKVINSASLTVPDGVGVIMAGKLLGTPFSGGKVAGVELGERILALSDGEPVYLLGGKPGTAELARGRLCEKYKSLNVVGTHDGYFNDDAAVIDEINKSGARILFVCLGAPKQENWVYANRIRLNVRVIGCFGGSIDSYAGTVRRAPEIFIRLGLEWFYRLIKQPSRIGRMMKLPKFILGTVVYKIKK